MILEYNQIRGKVPVRANPSDAGMDLFWNPSSHLKQERALNPRMSSRFETGIQVEVPHGFMLQIMNRSGMASKNDLIVGACVVDSGYSGEIFVDLHNIGAFPHKIKAGDKIAQMVLIPVVHFRLRETKEELYREEVSMSNRGSGCLGSTDNK